METYAANGVAMQIGHLIVEIMQILGISLLTMDDVKDLLEPFKRTVQKNDDGQRSINLQYRLTFFKRH